MQAQASLVQHMRPWTMDNQLSNDNTEADDATVQDDMQDLNPTEHDLVEIEALIKPFYASLSSILAWMINKSSH